MSELAFTDRVCWGVSICEVCTDRADTGRTLLFAPFVPFIILFCHVIETQDKRDLDLLSGFTSSMKSAPAISDAATRMLQLFRVLFSAARHYVELRSSTPSSDQVQMAESLQSCLAELGLPMPDSYQECPPNETGQWQSEVAGQALQDENIAENGDENVETAYRAWMGSTTHLEEWFHSNSQIMELLNEPSFTFQTYQPG